MHIGAQTFFISRDAFQQEALRAFSELVARAEFPCLGAKAALNAEAFALHVYEALGTDEATAALARDLHKFARSEIPERNTYTTMIAVFSGPRDLTELEFERLLWLQLQKLHEADVQYFDWDSQVSSDPTDPQFSFSFAGEAFYVVGMHANSSRMARRFAWPTLVFNPHEQFERLRAEGNWKRMQQSIRVREVELQGSINPMLSEFGEKSEARQYSGRAVEENWTPPFLAKKCPFAH